MAPPTPYVAIVGDSLSTQPWIQMGGSSTTAAEAIEVIYSKISERLGQLHLDAAELPPPTTTKI